MDYFHSETVEQLVPLVQKVLHNRDKNKHLFKPEDLKGVKDILDIWAKKKKHFRNDYFNGNLIAELGEVSIHLGGEEKVALIKEFIKKLDEDWNSLFPDFEYYNEEVGDLCDFLESNEDQIFSNKNEIDWEAPDGTIISAGTKISKSFKHFFDEPELVRQLQDKFSMLIQQDKMTGTLCASIHPLDYLSSSENNYKWRSCHALNGDYASGNVSYMMDRCTIIFYLKGADDVKLPRFPYSVPWNDKKWRMLMCIHPEERIVWAGRQYPFFSQDLMDKCLDMINQMIGFTFKGWEHEYIDRFAMPVSFEERTLSDLYIYRYGSMFTRNQLIRNAKYSSHYNDLLYSSVYVPYYAFNMYESIDPCDPPKILVGHTRVCAYCGKPYDGTYGMDTDEFICDACEEIIDPPRCESCHGICKTEDLTWYPYYGYLCPNCELEYTVACPTCGRRHGRDRQCPYCRNPYGRGRDSYELLQDVIEEVDQTTENTEETLRELYDRLAEIAGNIEIVPRVEPNVLVNVEDIAIDRVYAVAQENIPPPSETIDNIVSQYGFNMIGVDLAHG